MLGGTVDVDSNRGQWQTIGRRANVFAGLPYALYLPPHTTFTVTATQTASSQWPGFHPTKTTNPS